MDFSYKGRDVRLPDCVPLRICAFFLERGATRWSALTSFLGGDAPPPFVHFWGEDGEIGYWRRIEPQLHYTHEPPTSKHWLPSGLTLQTFTDIYASGEVPADQARQIAWYRPLRTERVLAVQYDGTNGRSVEFVSGGAISTSMDGRPYLRAANWGTPLTPGTWVVKESGHPRHLTPAEFNKRFRYVGPQHIPGISDAKEETVAKSKGESKVSKPVVADSEATITGYDRRTPERDRAVRFNGENRGAIEALTGLEAVMPLVTYRGLAVLRLAEKDDYHGITEGDWVVERDGTWDNLTDEEFRKEYVVDGEEQSAKAETPRKEIVGDGESKVALYTPTDHTTYRAVRFNGENAEEVRAVTGGEVELYSSTRHGKAARVRDYDGTYEVYKGQWVVRLDDDWTTFEHDEFGKRFRYTAPAEPPKPDRKTETVTLKLVVPSDMTRGEVEDRLRELFDDNDFGQHSCVVQGE